MVHEKLVYLKMHKEVRKIVWCLISKLLCFKDYEDLFKTSDNRVLKVIGY